MNQPAVQNEQQVSIAQINPSEQNHQLIMLQQQVAQLEACRSLAAHYCCTAMVPKQYQGRAEDGAVAIQWGAEIGLKPMQALQNVAVVNGNPTLWGDALVALVRQSGVCEYITGEYDEAKYVYTVKTKRKDQPEESNSYSLADAERAGLAGRDTYKKHLKAMLKNRARAHLLRDVYADILKGFQVREVLEEDRDVLGVGASDAPKVKDMGVAEVEEETYPQDKFELNFAKWEEAVLAGKKSQAEIISMIETRAKLTDEQKSKINNIQVEQQQ